MQTCQLCQGRILYDPDKKVLTCAECGELYDPILAMMDGREIDPMASKAYQEPFKLLIIERPSEIEAVTDSVDKIHFRIDVKSEMRHVSLTIMLVWNSFALLWVSMLRVDFDALLFILGIVPAAIGIWLIVLTFLLFFRKPELSVDRHFLIGPSLLRRQGVVVDRDRILQIFLRQESKCCQLVLRQREGTDLLLLDSLQEDVALYLEQRIEQFLHPLDQPNIEEP